VNETSVNLPVVISANPSILYECSSALPLALYHIDPGSPGWIYESPFEFLLLIKNFLLLSPAVDHLAFVRQTLLEALVADSPFLAMFAGHFISKFTSNTRADFRGVPSSYFSLLDRIILLRTAPEEIRNFAMKELSAYRSHWPIVRDVGPFLPEFFQTPLDPLPDSFQCSIAIPASLQSRDSSPLCQEVCDILLHYDRFEDFPFWVYFPFWVAFSLSLSAGSADVKPAELRDAFIADCRHLVFEWRREDTQRLLELTLNTFSNSFSADVVMQAWPHGPPQVVRMVGYALYVLNRICLRQSTLNVSPALSAFVAPDAMSGRFARSVVRESNARPLRLTINRRLTQCAGDDGRPANGSSIVAQVAAGFAHEPPTAGRATPLPWKVTFVGEPAIDAGGPARELMNEFAASIFHPATALTIPGPTARDVFLPFSSVSNPTISSQYRMIGKFLGIVVRTGLCQALPFAPLVWSYIVGERPGEADIVQIDSMLGNIFRSLRDGTHTQQEWTLLSWTGNAVPLPNRKRRSIVAPTEINDYIAECVAYRIDSIVPFLEQIKAGFFENIGIKGAPYLSAFFLSRVCQGELVIPVSALKECVSYDGYGPQDQTIQILWAVVEELSNEERSLFLRFITTLTRLPAKSAGTFRIAICKRACDSPNRELIRAATCFNRLALPPYSDFDAALRMIRLAIHLTPTMEVS
jgi:hypothetical protein